MARPRYTERDMRRLAEVSAPGSIPAAFLPALGYSPRRFKELLEEKGLNDDARHLFEMDITEIPPLVVDESRSGYFKFRMSIHK